MIISVIGLGYIGLPTAAFIASKGYKVFGYDLDKTLINNLNKRNFNFPEQGLNELLKSALNSNDLEIKENIVKSDIYIVCVPTPIIFKKNKPKTDLSYVRNVIDGLIKNSINENSLVILESTSPVGTTKEIAKTFNDAGLYPNLAYCPERVIPGNLLNELNLNDRIIGGIDEKSSRIAADFYNSIIEGEVFLTNSQTAELCKLAENSYRDSNLAFANELSIIASNNEINPYQLIDLANKHPRVNILKPGPGVGGHCIAVDPWFIVEKNPEAKFIESARRTNLHKTEHVIEEIKKEIFNFLNDKKRNPRLCFFGLAYKPDIDDLRESPACNIVDEFIDDSLEIAIVEPFIDSYKDINILKNLPTNHLFDIFVFLVNHSQFKGFLSTKVMATTKVIDFCGILHEFKTEN